jgi:hypothetical protein
MFSLVAWMAIGFAGIYWMRAIGIEFTPEYPEPTRLLIVWILLLASGAAFGAAVGVLAGKQLLWAIVGIAAAPISVMLWTNLVY